MSYKKIQPSLLFTGTTLLEPGQVLVLDETGTVADIVPETEAGLDILHLEGIVSPGFVNCHCHLELSHMKGQIPEATGLVDFVFKVVNGRHFPDGQMADAIRAGEDEMRRGGIVAVGDISNHASTLTQKEKQQLAYYTFIEASGWMPAVANSRFAKAQDLYRAFSAVGNSSISPHAPYSVSEALWDLMIPSFSGKTITIHNQETAFEDELFQTGQGGFQRMYGMMNMDTSFFTPPGHSSLRSFLGKLKTAERVLLVHNTFTSEADIVYAHQQHPHVSWCICVNANLYIENAVPPVQLIRENKGAIVIGTDSLASNHSLSVLDELKTITRHFPQIPLAEKLQWATLNGAQALQMQDMLGSFEKGKRPGAVWIRHLGNGDITEASESILL